MSLYTRRIINILRHNNMQFFKNRCLTPATSRHSSTTATESESSKTEQTPQNEEGKQLSETEKQIEDLNKQVADFKDKYQRTLADRENVRSRLEKQVQDAKLYGIQGFCKDLLEVSDVFRKALENVPKSEVGSEQLRSLFDGLSMTETQLLTVFRRHGLTSAPIEPGQKFDPGWHEAMFEVPSASEDQQPGTIAHVLRPAWNLHKRCIRSAQVSVYKE